MPAALVARGTLAIPTQQMGEVNLRETADETRRGR
jgi:hypothetical protein